MMAIKQRIQTPDLIKGFAVLFMIQVHILELFAKQSIYDGLVGSISLFLGGIPAAPMFMAIMGYFIAKNQKSTGRLILRGLKLIVAGLILNIGLNAHLIYRVLNDGWQINIWQYIFGVDILLLAGLSFIIIAILIRLFKNNFIGYFGLAILIVLLNSILPNYVAENTLINYLLAFFHSSAEWSYFPLIPWLAYPLTGMGFYLLLEKYPIIKQFKWSILFAILLVIAAVIYTFSFAFQITSNLPEYYHHGILFYLWSLAFMAILTLGFFGLEKTAGNMKPVLFVKWLGVNVTTVYIFQWLIIGNIATAVFKTMNLTDSILWFFGITIISSMLTYFWNILKSITSLKNLRL